MKRLFLIFIGFLIITGLGVYAWSFFQDQTTVRVITQVRNLSTGEEVKRGSVVHVGDILERSVFVENTINKPLKRVIIESVNLFTNTKELKTIDLAAKNTEVLTDRIPVTAELVRLPVAARTVFVPEVQRSLLERVFPSSQSPEKKSETPVRTFASSGNTVTASSSLSPVPESPTQEIPVIVQPQPQVPLAFWEISSINTTKINNNFESFFEVRGNHLKSITQLVFQCPNKAVFVPVSIVQDTLLQVSIPAFALPAGDCQLGVEVNSIAYFSNYIILVEQSQTAASGVFLQGIVPNIGTVDKDSLLILQGRGFDKVVAVQIDNGVVLDLKFLQKISDTTLVVNVPKGLAVGDYYFRFLTQNSVASFPNIPFKLQAQ